MKLRLFPFFALAVGGSVAIGAFGASTSATNAAVTTTQTASPVLSLPSSSPTSLLPGAAVTAVPLATPTSPINATASPDAGVAPLGGPPPPQSVPQIRESTAPVPPGSSTPVPVNGLVTFSGQLLDYRSGYAFFTTGDGFHVASDVKIVDAKTGTPSTQMPRVKLYARATFDATGHIVELALSKDRLPGATTYEQVQHFAVALSPPVPNPDLVQTSEGGPGSRPATGRPVAVTFVAQVPPTTPFGDAVYVTTDTSGWNPEAIRLDRIDALHYRAIRTFASGTRFQYKYTRGTWTTEERGENGLENAPRSFYVTEADALRKDDIVYHWADEVGSTGEAGPNAIPTPFNPNPFQPNVVPTPLNGPAAIPTFNPNISGPHGNLQAPPGVPGAPPAGQPQIGPR